MSSQFSGVWASFEYLDDMCNAIKKLRTSGFTKITTVSPCPRHEITDALGDPQSRVPFFTLIMGLIGVTTAFVMCTWMSLDWVLPVSGKPIVSVPPFTVIGFELTVLLGAYGTMAGVIILSIIDTLKNKVPTSQKYKEYNKFSRDRFGIIVPCAEKDFSAVEGMMNEFHAEEVNREN